jgi:VCBS repeat protein
VKFADLDGDRKADVLSVQPNGDVRAWRNCLGFAPMPWCGDNVIIASGITDPTAAFFPDLDGDGRADIAYVQPGGEIRAWHNGIGFGPTPWRGDNVVIATGFAAATTKFADLDGDGKSEIMAVQANGEVRAWHNIMGFAPTPWRGDNVVVATGVTDPARAFFL